jgi:CheY-like chemotaxis protein
MSLQILFADDQIPDDQIDKKDLDSYLKNKYPNSPSGFRNACKAMRETVQRLRNAGFNVETSNNYESTIKKGDQIYYDLIIMDLGWTGDKQLSNQDSHYYGWNICEEIKKINIEKKRSESLIIMFSQRFMESPELSRVAAQKGYLPVFKDYGETSNEALIASIKFIEWHLSTDRRLARSLATETRQLMLDSLVTPLEQQKRWFSLTVSAVLLSLTLIIIGILTVLFGEFEVGILTTLTSILTGAISTLFFKQLQKNQQIAQDNRKEISNVFSKTVYPLLEKLEKN